MAREREMRVLIVSPYAASRAGLSALASEDADVRIAGLVSGSAEIGETFATAMPDVVLADPAAGDAPFIVEVAARLGIRLVLLSDEVDFTRALAASSLPGWAMLPRDAEAPEIQAAMRAVSEGLVVLGRAAALPALAAAPRVPTIGEASGETLTAREREVLQLLADGLPNKVVANRLSVSLHTVKFHVASILAKLGASSRTEAVTIGARRGLVTL